MRKKILSLFCTSLLFIQLTACGTGSSSPVEQEGIHMGTLITERVYGSNAQKAADEAMARIQQLDTMMTINAQGSEVDKLNAEAGKSAVKMSPESMYVMDTAVKYAKLSDGAFDITIGPLVKAWGVGTDHQRILAQSEIDTLKALVDYHSLTLDMKASTAKLEKPGQMVDLGGIAKGYAGDEAVKVYKKYGIKSAYINLGGNVVTLGGKPDGSPWTIGIQNPRDVNGKIVGYVKVADKTVVSSGDYERYFIENGKRYHHILDSKTGYPASSGLMATTIVTDFSINADALSTSVFVLGLDKGMKLIESLKGVEALFITTDKKIYVTPGLKNSFTFEDDSKEYAYVEKR